MSTPRAFVGPEGENEVDVHIGTAPAALYRKTESGLSYKDFETGTGEEIAADAFVSIRFTASVVSTGEEIQKASMSFQRGSNLELFDEAIEGMRVGGKRRVVLPPSSKFAALPEESVEFEIEAIAVASDADKAFFRVGSVVGGVGRLAFFWVVTQTLLDLVLPTVDAASSSGGAAVDAANAWAAQGLSSVGLM